MTQQTKKTGPTLIQILDALGYETVPSGMPGQRDVVAPNGVVLFTGTARGCWAWLKAPSAPTGASRAQNIEQVVTLAKVLGFEPVQGYTDPTFYHARGQLSIRFYKGTSAVQSAHEHSERFGVPPCEAVSWVVRHAVSLVSGTTWETNHVWRSNKLISGGVWVAQVSRGLVDRLFYWTHADGTWGHRDGFETVGEARTACEKHFAHTP